MSLLMEALRKAEEAKRRMQQQEQLAASGVDMHATPEPRLTARVAAPTDTGFTLEEREPNVTPEYILDNFTTEPHAEHNSPAPNDRDDHTDADQDTYSPQVDPYLPPAAERASPRMLARKQKTAAASVFAAKQHPARNRRTMTILVLVMVSILPIGGGILWYLQSIAPPSIGFNPAVASYDLASRGFIGDEAPASAVQPAVTSIAATPEPVANAPVAAVAPAVTTEVSVEPVDAPGTAVVAAAAEAIIANPGATSEIAAAPEPPATVPGSVPVSPPGTAVPAIDPPGSTPAPEPAGVLEISRSGGTRSVNPGLVTAYNRLQSGDLLVAGQLYQEVLNQLPNNRDALLGLALVHLRQGQLSEARESYARLLQLNPRDPLAHAGLLQSMQVVDPVEHESTLKSLLEQYPEVAPLEMALGNLYASQQRWSEAQGAYYNALLTASRNTGGPVHPDYAFNLAVSLEQLNQNKAALDYYRQAQALARDVTPGFDPQLLNSRLAYLEQSQP